MSILEQITETAVLSGYDLVNRDNPEREDTKLNAYLHRGWLILNTWKEQVGYEDKPSESLCVLVGWPKPRPAVRPVEKVDYFLW
jgi:hypothetical protein